MEQSSGLRKDMSRITAAHAVPGIFKNINQKRIGMSRIAAAQVVTIIKPILIVSSSIMSWLRHLAQILLYLAGDVLLQLLCALVVMNATRFVEFPVLVTVHI